MGKEKKKAKQVAIFSSPSKDKLQLYLNDNLIKISEDGHEYSDIRIWSEGKIWCGVIEFIIEVDASSKEDIEKENKLIRLKEFAYNSSLPLSEIGLFGCQAFILQNGIEIDLELPYITLMDKMEEEYGFSRDKPVSEFSMDVEQINVEINLP